MPFKFKYGSKMFDVLLTKDGFKMNPIGTNKWEYVSKNDLEIYIGFLNSYGKIKLSLTTAERKLHGFRDEFSISRNCALLCWSLYKEFIRIKDGVIELVHKSEEIPFNEYYERRSKLPIGEILIISNKIFEKPKEQSTLESMFEIKKEKKEKKQEKKKEKQKKKEKKKKKETDLKLIGTAGEYFVTEILHILYHFNCKVVGQAEKPYDVEIDPDGDIIKKVARMKVATRSPKMLKSKHSIPPTKKQLEEFKDKCKKIKNESWVAFLLYNCDIKRKIIQHFFIAFPTTFIKEDWFIKPWENKDPEIDLRKILKLSKKADKNKRILKAESGVFDWKKLLL